MPPIRSRRRKRTTGGPTLGVDPLWAMAAAQAKPVKPPVPPPTRSDPDAEADRLAQLRLTAQQTQEAYDNDRHDFTMQLMDGYALSPEDTFALAFRGPCDPTLTTDPATCGIDGPPYAPDPVFAAKLAAVAPAKVVVLSTPIPSVPAQLASRTGAINAAAAAQAAAAHAAGNAVTENPDGTMSIWQDGRETVLID
jgi:hypothetical protein